MKLNLLVLPGYYFIIGTMLSEPEAGDCTEPISTSDGKFDMDAAGRTTPDTAYRLVKPERKKGCPRATAQAGQRVPRARRVWHKRVSKVTAPVDRSLCGDHEARIYPDPAMTVCLEKP